MRLNEIWAEKPKPAKKWSCKRLLVVNSSRLKTGVECLAFWLVLRQEFCWHLHPLLLNRCNFRTSIIMADVDDLVSMHSLCQFTQITN